MMPRGYNWDMLQELKKKPNTKDNPIIVVTTMGDKEKVMAMGADSYIQKPFHGGLLHQEVGRFLIHR